ncbi:ATP-binding protein [Breznakiellaceae bacterium SP9]
MTIDSLSERQYSRNELLSSLLARYPMNVDAPGSTRNYIMDKRGEGVPIIMIESRQLSGIKPEYTLIDDAELKLTIFAASPVYLVIFDRQPEAKKRLLNERIFWTTEGGVTVVGC